MISVLVPSRGRPDALAASLNSLGIAKHGLEALVWLDDDDPAVDLYVHRLSLVGDVKVFVKKRVGYLNWHVMLNFLASQATRDWLVMWADDALMPNKNWFSLFTEFVARFDPVTEPVVINTWNPKNGRGNLLPILSRCFYTVLGHLSLNTACDDWIWRVARKAAVSVNLPGMCPVLRKELETDETHREVETVRSQSGGTFDLFGRESKRLRALDVEKLLAYKARARTSPRQPGRPGGFSTDEVCYPTGQKS